MSLCVCFFVLHNRALEAKKKKKKIKKMLLGKRPRPPMKRTTSMTGITVDPSMLEPQDPSDHHHHHHHPMITDSSSSSLQPPADQTMNMNMMSFAPNPNGYEYEHDNRFLAMVSPGGTTSHITRSNSGGYMNDPHFLHTCGLCKRRLPPGRDIYMYRYKYKNLSFFLLYSKNVH